MSTDSVTNHSDFPTYQEQLLKQKAKIEEETYQATHQCSNCGWTGPVRAKKGVLLRDTPCPFCGCTPNKSGE
ncbi:hypothetical protein UFOVP591_30 [uncultured Caudovirales phage]|uniref:Uncharacterized protein n=1 Tax=uncultured Caudovirales phage TaxID=2100421 RepID=A0A6J5N0P2_9CAUD|nr:hypothetical protein UFOVP591_30 [uncultured Caudovirales phage]